jgi:hypothetical protein
MGANILVYGESGAGKSTSLRNLNPKETFIINVLGKPLPFRGWQKKYTKIDSQNNPSGNYYSSINFNDIGKTIDYVINKRPDIKVLVIDDFTYMMTDDFMSRALEKGYDKFAEMALHVYENVRRTSFARDDLKCIFFCHSDNSDPTKVKLKTIGKMLDEKISLEGLFTIVLYAFIREEKHTFLTNNNGNTLAKSPMGMFEESCIENDLQEVIKKVDRYYGFLDEDVPNMPKPEPKEEKKA